MKLLITAGLIAASLLSATAQAQTTPRADVRQARQEARIQQGVASGELTAREAAKLERGQAHVQNVETQAKADGVVTKQERARLQHAQNVQNKKIHHQKHDRQQNGS